MIMLTRIKPALVSLTRNRHRRAAVATAYNVTTSTSFGNLPPESYADPSVRIIARANAPKVGFW